MTEIILANNNLPSTIEDLAKFVLVGREKMVSVRAEIRAIDKLGLGKEVRQQKLDEGQMISEALLDAEVRIGELTAQMPKATKWDTAENQIDSGVELIKPKMQAVKEAGFTQKQVERFESLAEHPEIVAQAKAEAREQDDIVSRSFVLEKIKAAEKVEKREQKAERKDISNADASGYQLICADIANGLPEIPDNSIDFIITDPPYPREFIPLYGHLSAVAARVLKDGGSALVMCGQSYLPQVIYELCKNLTYHWMLCYLTPGGQSPSLWQKRTNTFWKPVLWLTKGEYKGDYIGDKLSSPVNDNDKEFHKWGQSAGGFTEIIEKFTCPGQTILDPFLGGGTTGLVCVGMKRNFIGADIDPACIETTRSRLQGVKA
jgi:site-specific DNA-methyltransferase (adenine-specific)